MARRKRLSRLARKEETRNLRQAVFFGFLTIILLLLLIFLGIPILIRMAIFLSEIRSSSLPIKTEDVLPPAPPSLTPLPPATNSAQIALKGFAETGSTVEIFLNGASEAKLVTEKDGGFATSQITLTTGRNEITATAKDEAGNTSQSSGKMIIYYETTPPELTISEPADGSSFYGDEDAVKILGSTKEGAKVTVNEHLVVVGHDGEFEFLFPLTDGENIIKVTAVDQAGNKTEKKLTVTYSL